ncbi:MAG: UDP-2,4-diacetamido-2,4,6-trideoxy-beta-L-altropyranose hydrolase [Micavibrio sp.]
MSRFLAAFRFYASSWRGAGHAMRCMTLARVLQKSGWDCLFVTEQESYDFFPGLQEFERVDPEKFYAHPPMHNLLIVDHYDCGYEYEHHFRPYTQCIMVIDDIANRKHDCDFIVDQAYGRHSDNYASDVPKGCSLLMGPEYALLRDEFPDLREKSIQRRKSINRINRIFLNFGGNDQKNMILETLKELSSIGYSGAIDVVFGLIAEHRQSVEEFASKMINQINFHTNPDMAQLLVQADLAVGAPAVSAWERFCLGVPTILLQTADNQSFTYQALLRDGLALGGTLKSLSQPGLVLGFDLQFYNECVDKVSSQTDGRGAYKIAHLIQEFIGKKDAV